MEPRPKHRIATPFGPLYLVLKHECLVEFTSIEPGKEVPVDSINTKCAGKGITPLSGVTASYPLCWLEYAVFKQDSVTKEWALVLDRKQDARLWQGWDRSYTSTGFGPSHKVLLDYLQDLPSTWMASHPFEVQQMRVYNAKAAHKAAEQHVARCEAAIIAADKEEVACAATMLQELAKLHEVDIQTNRQLAREVDNSGR